MANQITDNRVKLADANNITDGISGTWVGSTSPVQDTDIKIEGTASIAEQMTNSVRYVMWNAGSPQNYDNNVFYIWVNCGVVGLLDIKANGGFRIRFAGATVTDFFEVYVGGSDSWPNAVLGGWVQFVVDIVGARATAITNGWTGGTAPAVTAIQHIGYAAITTAMTKVSDNCWIDAIWRLADGSPGVIVEGRNAGTTPWNFADIFTQLTSASGAIKEGPAGSWVINTPIQIGINDTTTHEFSDTNATIFWDNQEYAPSDLYKVSAIGNAGGTTNVTLGIKSGTGDAATGAQGCVLQAAASGVRWAMDFSGANLNSIGLYGCSFVHAGAISLNNAAVDLATCLFLDCTSANVTGSNIVRPSVVDANTADGVAFMTTDDIDDIAFGDFQFSDGHAVEITSGGAASQPSTGNKFTGYGAIGTNDAAIYNNSAAARTINVTNSGDTPTYRNGTSASTTVQNAVSLDITVLDSNKSPIELAQTSIFTDTGTQLMNEDTNASGLASESYNYAGPQNIVIKVRKSATTDNPRYKPFSATGQITASGFSLTVTLTPNPVLN